MDCLFCTITSGTMGTEFLYEDDRAVAFRDIHPKAPVHLLVVPKQHVASIADMEEQDSALIGHLSWIAKQLAEELEIADDGYRLIVNVRSHGGQEIDHLHLHLVGGQPLGPLVS
ncbi:histidine triad nucleotide-binding protein [Candidatus Berkelbacteria bacterium]|nr:histidine triad nucleotide-binding protein [Candidatus Berkelbacteria bacterium]